MLYIQGTNDDPVIKTEVEGKFKVDHQQAACIRFHIIGQSFSNITMK